VNHKFISFYAFLLLFAGAIAPASAHTPSDPGFMRPEPSKPWKTLVTPHFRINHEAGQQDYARQMGAIAEQVHNKLSAWLHWQPEGQTEIVILDNVDFSNGWATVLPYNQFTIYMPTPAEGELMDQNPWMEYVFAHEYIHILHLDMANGSAQTYRKYFGRPAELFAVLTFPQIFAPSWVTEGLAVYGESDNAAGYGRLNNAWYEAEMRMEVQHGLRSLTEVSFEGYSGSRWPNGLNYLYGAYFFKFINERYGREAAINYIRIYSYNLIPWRMDTRSELMFGKSAQVVWQEFQLYLQQRFAAQAASSIPSALPLYATPYINRHLSAAGNGDVYFYHDDAALQPQIRRLRADGSSELLFKSDNIGGMDWNDAGGLLLNKAAVCDNVKYYVDLYRWKPDMAAPERLTECGRYVRAAWRPDAKKIAAVQLDRGQSKLVLLDANGKNPETVSEFALGDTLGHLAWSPDGTQIVASVQRQRSGWNLELFKIKENRWQTLTSNNDRVAHPHFSKNGSDIYFTSDHNGAWNLRTVNINSNIINTLSNSPSGISEAIEMPDASYRSVEYSAQGWVINQLSLASGELDSYATTSPTPPHVEAIINAEDYQPFPYENVQDYSPWQTLQPRSWVPFLYWTADQNSYAGVTLYGSDVLGFHQWTAVPYLYTSQQNVGGYLAYRYHNWLTLYADRQTLMYGKATDRTQMLVDEVRYQAIVHHSFNSSDNSIYLSAGISRDQINESFTNLNHPDFNYHDSLLGVVARYDNTEYYQRSISLTEGRRVQYTGESYDLPGSTYHSGTAHQLDWKEYIPLGDSHVLHLRMFGASGDSKIRPFTLGGELDSLISPDGLNDLGRRKIMLRGYPSGLAALTGNNVGLISAEWRIPLGLVYDGFFVPPIGLGRHSLSVFMDTGDAWKNGEKIQNKTGAGLAWNAETLLGYDMLHIGLTLGVAQGFDQGGEKRVYLMLGQPY
jgi:hypothetical protein